MKHRKFLILLIVLGIVCAVLGALLPGSVLALSALPGLTVLPFALPARMLRALSLLGGAGNIAAWVLYLLICLAPLAVLAKHRSRCSCILAPVLSILLLGGMYLLINPGAAAGLPGSAALLTQLEGAPIGGILWSVIMAWVVLELLDKGSRPGVTLTFTRRLLHLLCAWTAASVCLFQAAGLALTLGTDSGLSLVMRLLNILVATATELLTVPVFLGTADLLEAMSAGPDDRTVDAADSLAALATRILKLTVILRLGCHLLQLALCGLMSNSSWQLDLPLTELAFALGALLLARFVGETKRIKDENDLFI